MEFPSIHSTPSCDKKRRYPPTEEPELAIVTAYRKALEPSGSTSTSTLVTLSGEPGNTGSA
jgi:hypothetical protein